MAGGVWQAEQSVLPMLLWLKVALRKLVVAVWQSRHAPGYWLGGGVGWVGVGRCGACVGVVDGWVWVCGGVDGVRCVGAGAFTDRRWVGVG